VNTQAVALWPVFRFTHTVAGMAAAAAGEWEAAQDYFQTALRQAETFPHLVEQAEIYRFHAMMLIDRSAPGDRGAAQKSLSEARQSYARIGMCRHVELTQALIDQTAIKPA
jgi:hypothetical protein